jgi:hypothetical protein
VPSLMCNFLNRCSVVKQTSWQCAMKGGSLVHVEKQSFCQPRFKRSSVNLIGPVMFLRLQKTKRSSPPPPRLACTLLQSRKLPYSPSWQSPTRCNFLCRFNSANWNSPTGGGGVQVSRSHCPSGLSSCAHIIVTGARGNSWGDKGPLSLLSNAYG